MQVRACMRENVKEHVRFHGQIWSVSTSRAGDNGTCVIVLELVGDNEEVSVRWAYLMERFGSSWAQSGQSDCP